MSREQKARLVQRFSFAAGAVFLGAAYYAWLKFTGAGVPCIFKSVTGYFCPGCGITRMAEALLKSDFESAYGYNGAVFVLLPFWGAAYGIENFRYVKDGTTEYTGFSKVVLFVSCAVLLIFGVVRNI